MRKQFTLNITVKTRPCNFDDLCIGETFTLESDIGFGDIWIGFPIYCKVNPYTSANLSDGTNKYFNEDDIVLPITIGSVNKNTSNIE